MDEYMRVTGAAGKALAWADREEAQAQAAWAYAAADEARSLAEECYRHAEQDT